MSLHLKLHTPFHTGGQTDSEVPGVYPVGLDGRGYFIDWDGKGTLSFHGLHYHHETIPVLKPQQQTSGALGARSINPEGLWRTSIETWYKGAGQLNYDLDDSDAARFRSSKGVDPWTKWELQLLPDTTQSKASANTNLLLAVAGSRLYVSDGTGVSYTTDLITWTAVTGLPGSSITGLDADGFNVWIGTGVNGIYRTDTTTGAAVSYETGTVNLVAYVKARLMVSNGASIYNVTAAGALPGALFTHANSSFTWVGFATGRNVIYAAGYAGDKSLIYRISVVADGTTLGAPVVAGELPDGEIVRSIAGYLSFLLIGTDKGVRFATQDSNGDLTIGALISTTSAVQAFEGQGSFAWFGWTNYDGVSTGLGRMSLTTINDTTPAYASDLMVTGQGAVLSIVTFLGLRVFTVSGLGVYKESTNKVASGTLDSGLITYGIPDTKIALDYRIRYLALAGTITASLAADGGAFANIATANTVNATRSNVGVAQVSGEKFELRLTLARSGTDATQAPIVTRQVLGVDPQADTLFKIVVPLMLNESDGLPGSSRGRDVAAELLHIQWLRSNRTVVPYQEGTRTYSVIVEDFYWLPNDLTSDVSAFQGTCVVQLKAVS